MHAVFKLEKHSLKREHDIQCTSIASLHLNLELLSGLSKIFHAWTLDIDDVIGDNKDMISATVSPGGL